MKYSLTSTQQTFNTEKITLDSPIWNQALVVMFKGEKKAEELSEIINELIRDNDVFRTRFEEDADGQLWQSFTEYEKSRFDFLSFENEKELDDFLSEIADTPTSIFKNPFRFYSFKLPGKFGIILRIHHMLCDGFCVPVIIDKIKSKLDLCEKETKLYSYEKHIIEENSYKESKRFERNISFWNRTLSENFNNALFYNDSFSREYSASECRFSFSKASVRKAKQLCESEGIPLSAFAYAVFGIYVKKVLNINDFSVGMSVSNRLSEDDMHTLGLFTHILPLIQHIGEDATFLSVLENTYSSIVDLLKNQKFTQYDIEHYCSSEKKNNVLYDTTVDYQPEFFVPDCESKVVFSRQLSVPLEIHFYEDKNDKLIFMARYRNHMFLQRDIVDMFNSLEGIIDAFVEEPNALVSDTSIDKLRVLPEEEKQKLLHDFNDTQRAYPKDKCVHELFEEQAERTPDKTALIASGRTLTYRELNEEANRTAHSLIEKGIGVGDIVAFALPRKSYLLSTMLGIMKSGAAYLPIDPDYPKDRIEYMLKDSGAKLFVTEDNIGELLKNVNTSAPSVSVSADDICYCIYTSGSTGRAKGVMIKHANLLYYVNNVKEIYNDTEVNMPFFTNPSVDLTVTSIYLPLLTAGCVYVYDTDLTDSMKKIVENSEITVIKMTPTHLKMFNELKALSEHLALKHIILGGEALFSDDVVRFLNKYGKDIKIHNEYGPTETTVGCADYIFSNADISDGGVSIGKPTANTRLYILDKYLNPVPLGVTGELCIAGDGVGAGYLNRPELTAEKFVDNPFGEGKLYKTGDLAYWREDGNIMYVGRNDFQVKIRGLRIELGEIENAISSVEGINQSVAVVRKDKENRQLICAFYTGDEKNSREIRKVIGERLPKYMLPHIFTHIDEMPLTSSGKINRNALPEIDLENIESGAEYVAPATEGEEALVDSIKTVLKTEKVSVLDNFFEIGGDSIKAIHIVAELQNKGYELPVSAIMQSDTIADTAEQMKSAEIKREYTQNEVIGEMEFSPIMKAYLKGKPSSPETFMQSCIIESDCNEEELKKAVDEIVSHHDILKAVVNENGLLVRKSEDAELYSFERVTRKENVIEYLKNKEVRFDMENGPLVNVAFCDTEDGCIFRLSVHHFVIDLVSWEILLEDLRTALEQLKRNEKIFLPPKTASFPEWVEALNEHNAQAMSDDEREYWKETGEKLENAAPLFTEDSTELHEESYTFTLDEETTAKLINKANDAFKTRPNELLMAALGLAAAEITGGRTGILAESHGRAELKNQISVARTVGWFTSLYPVVFDNTSDISDTVIETRDTLRHIPYNGIGYLLTDEGLSDNASIIFNYYNGETAERESGIKVVDFGKNGSAFPGKAGVDCLLLNGKLNVSIVLSAYTKKQGLTEQLALLFKEKLEELIDVCVSTESDYSNIYSLTPAQEGMYYQYRIDPLSKIYHLSFLFEIGKGTDLELLERSVALLAVRHEVLNTAITASKTSAKQVILKSRKPDFLIKTVDKDYAPAALEEIIRETEEEPIDLQKDTLFRVRIADFNDARYMVIYTHHIILDGWSMPVLLKDLDGIYRMLSEGISVSEMANTIQKEVRQNASFSGYVNLIKHKNRGQALNYWKELFRDYEPSKLFESSRKGGGTGNETAEVSVGELSDEINRFAKSHKLSLNTVFESAFGLLLQNYSSSEDVVFCKPISGRTVPLKGIENAAGPFINTVLSRIRSREGQTVEELFNEVQNQSVETNRLGYLSLSELHRECEISKDSVEVLFAFENYYIGDSDITERSALKLQPVSNNEQTEFPLSVSVSPIDGNFRITANYSKEHFTENQISDFIESYIFILKQITEEKVSKTSEIKSLNEKQFKELADFNDTDFDYPKAESIYELFEKTVSERENELCIETAEKTITFGEFKKSVEALDGEIRKHTSGKKGIVAVIANRSVEMYVAIYAAIRGGNAYMPISPDYPKDRIEFMLGDSGASLVLAQSEFTDLACGLPCIDISAFDYNRKNEEQTSCIAKPDDAAYVIYTSGSTGTPKGAMISHKSAINRILWMQKAYPLDENSVILQKTPYTFDVSVWELFWWGMCNGRLAAMKPNEHFMPASILDDCEMYSVTHLHFVPSVFDLFLSYLEVHREKTESFRSVKHVFLSGEALTAELVNRFYAIFDYKVKLHNLYGPTECAVDVTYYDCKEEEVNPVPIGKPIDNTQMYVVDRYMNIVPFGVTGELCIGGANVGLGYLNRPELIAEKFVDNPFGEGKLYKTGDLAYIREDGEIIFCGRKDFQVKLNGQRVELGEIEAVIAQHEKVEASAVTVCKYNGRDILVSYYTGEETNDKELKELCREKLPQYMIPALFIHLEKLPLNSSGKLDRKTLSTLPLPEFEFKDTFEEPVDETEQMICEAFKEVLDIETVDRHTDFYDAGGTSLDIIVLLSDERFKGVTASDFIGNSTPALLAKLMEKRKESSFRKLQCLAEAKNAKRAVVMFPYAGGSSAAFSALSKELAKVDECVSVYYADYPDKAEECDEIANEVIRLSESVEVSFYAHCVGSAVALQVAEIIERKNAPSLNYIIIGGSIPPKKAARFNLWNIVPDSVLTAILKKAGGRLNELPNETRKKLLADFRRNTDYAVEFYKASGHKLSTPIKVIISKDDLFTRNYKDAETNWKKYGSNVTVEFIESKSHYFQSDMADDVAKRIGKIIR